MTVDDELIDYFLNGDISQDEAAVVLRWLEAQANLERFARRAELHADLRSALRRKSIQSTALEALDQGSLRLSPCAPRKLRPVLPNRSFAYRKTTIAFGVIALATAACLLTAFVMRSEHQKQAPAPHHLASIASRINAVLTYGDSTWNETGLAVGEYQLEQGLLHLRFGGGVMVYVEAPARFDAVSGSRLVLHSGRLSASVPPEGVGFTVETPEAEVVDFGTEFSVDVATGSSEVHVFDGLVRVQPRSREGVHSGDAVDLRTSQAVKIEDTTIEPVGIAIARDKFIRNFDEPKRKYSRAVKQLSPIAYYRMAIRDKGLTSDPTGYSGVVLTGDGIRPPHASGVFAGGSMRVRAESTGRGGRVDSPPPLSTGQFSLAAFVFLESSVPGGTVATNIRGDDGNFSLTLDQNGRFRATIRDVNGDLQSVGTDTMLPLDTWCHLVVTANGESLRIYKNSQLVASTQCSLMATSDSTPLWFGTDSVGRALWDGRIDELALFDTALSENDIANLYQSALEEMAREQ